MSQVKTTSTSINSIIHSRHFIIGYNDAIGGKPYNDDYEKYAGNDQWNYERGRLYAIATSGSTPPKNGKRVNYRAIMRFNDLALEGVII